MTTDRFSEKDFEKVLADTLPDLKWKKVGLIGGELRYRVYAHDTGHGVVTIEINSSIDRSGFAQPQGENSIRLWLEGGEHPIGNKIQKWVTRVPGWQDRLADNLDRCVSMAQGIQWCEKCQSLEKVFIVHKEGKNKGRLFLRCNCPNSFVWLDETEEEETPKPVKADVKKYPLCPKCGGQMTLRTRKDGTGQFWGCRLYPACKGTRNVEDVPAPDEDEERKFDLMIQARDRQDEENAQRSKMEMEIEIGMGETPAPAVVEKPKTFTPSKYQLAVFEWARKAAVSKEFKALVVEATAGSGKTRTCVELLKLLPRSLDIVYIAFNKHVVNDMKTKAPDFVKICTDHSLGFAACRAALGKDLKVDKHKVDAILEGMLPRDQFGHLYAPVKKLVSLVKANLLSTSREDLQELVSYHSIDLNGETEIVFMTVASVVSKCMEMKNVIDFDDQVWFPVILNLPCHQYDFLLVDEDQDTNKCQTALMLKSIKKNGKIIAVGDRYQSLYGFRGADAEAVPNLIADLNADVLPLSVSYRCPKSVVQLINQKMPEIPMEFPEWAIEGIIRDLTYDKALQELVSGDMVLCRTNAPLVKPAFALIRKGVKAVIRGRDIGSGLLDLVKKMKAGNLVEMLSLLAEYQKKETEKLYAAGKDMQAQNLEDRIETIVALCDGINSISALEERIDKIFSDDNEGVVFSSVHRAKGLEATRVYILHSELMPHPMAKNPWEKVQERNCMFVAYSRTLSELIFIR